MENWYTNIPRIIIRYEDLIDNTLLEFNKIISFLSKILKFEIDDDQVNFCVKNSDFNSLSKYEKEYGFNESSIKGNLFFRKGIKNQWKKELTTSQIKKIEKEFNNEMRILEYI